MIKAKENRQYIVVCVLFPILILIILFSQYAVFFELDDIGMRNILSGMVSGKTEAHCYFMYYALASVLAFLYKHFSGVYWYLIFLLLCNYFCFALIMYRIMQKTKKIKSTLFIGCIIFVLLFINQFLLLEWTTTAGTLAACAVFWYGTIPDEKHTSYLEYIIPVCLLWIAYNLRHSVVEMAIPFAFLLFISKVYKMQNRKILKKNICFLGLCISVVLISYGINCMAYQSSEWKEAIKMGAYRSMLFDYYGYPNYSEYTELYEKNGISKEMYETMKNDANYLMAISGVLTPENLEPIVDKAEELYKGQSTLERIKKSLRNRCHEILGSDYWIYSIILYLEIIIYFIITFRKRDIPKLFLGIVIIIGFEMIWFYLFMKGRTPYRVGYGLYMVAIALVTSLLWNNEKIGFVWKKSIVKFTVIFFVSIIIGQIITGVNTENYKRYEASQTRKEAKIYCENHKDNFYIRDYLSFTQREVIQNHDENIAGNFRSLSEWNFCYPISDAYIPYGKELCHWIKEAGNVYLIVNSIRADEMCERQENLFASRGVSCEMRLIDSIQISNGTVLEIYKYVNK